jgi:predicted phage terminase large subunit-like protein
MQLDEIELDNEAFDQAAIIRELVDRGGLHEFIRIFWPLVESVPFLDNWHVGALCEHLERVACGDIKRLVVNIPPGCMKSLSCGIFWPTWLWTLDPTIKTLVASFDKTLVTNQAQKVIDILSAPEFQSAYPHVRLASKSPAATEFKTTAGGFRFSTSPEGKGTGRHVTGALIDDPLKPQDAELNRKAAFQKVNSWFSGTLQTRVREWIVCIMQRLHSDDLAAQCLANGYESLILPMRQVKRTMWARDPRTEVGELLWPTNPRFTEEKVRALELSLKSAASSQLQQDPVPMSGGIIEEQWTRLEWIEVPAKGTFVQSWDFSSKGIKESHSRVSGDLWCVTRDMKLVRELISTLDDRLARIPGSMGDGRIKTLPDRAEMFLLIDHVGGHWNFPRSKTEFLAAQNRPHWKRARVKLVERKANGQAIIDDLSSKLQGLIGIDPSDDKESRLRVHSDRFEIGQVVFPPGPDGDAAREELVKFPRFTHDDRVDTCTQALDRLAGKAQRYRENLAKIAREGGSGL